MSTGEQCVDSLFAPLVSMNHPVSHELYVVRLSNIYLVSLSSTVNSFSFFRSLHNQVAKQALAHRSFDRINSAGTDLCILDCVLGADFCLAS